MLADADDGQTDQPPPLIYFIIKILFALCQDEAPDKHRPSSTALPLPAHLRRRILLPGRSS